MENRKTLQVWLPNELHDALDALAKRERRSKASQVMYILERALSEYEAGAVGTQVSMPQTDEDREAALERIR